MTMSNNGTLGVMNLPTNSSVDQEDLSILVQELRELGFDAIRFASYRTAAKLRYIQKKSNFILVDLWNVIEGFRENGLSGLDPYSIITVPKLETVVTSLYVNLNKRLPLSQQVQVVSCARYLLSWLLIAYDNEGSGRVRVFSVKVGLVSLCSGKLIDKLRYIFSLISDTNGSIVLSRFSEYLQEVLALPAMVLETPTFGYTDGLAATIFDGTSKVTVNGFLDALLSDPGPPCLMWLPLLHSMASVEDVDHGVQCNICKAGSIQGFRYKCQKCSNFNMCQDCFWQGKTVENHRAEHEVKEYIACKSGGKGFRNSFRKSLRCVPDKPKTLVPRFPEEPERCLNLSHIVPPSPLPVHNGFCGFDSSLDAYNDQKLFSLDMGHGPNRVTNNSLSGSVSESDEEHKLIARYTARLASDGKYTPAPQFHSMQQSRAASTANMIMNTTLFDSAHNNQREAILLLENRNREIMNEIARLRTQQEREYLEDDGGPPVVMEELHVLREYKLDLEDKLCGLQDSRRQLMGQLEGLMKLLKVQQMSPGETPESSPRSGKTPPMPIYSRPGSLHRSAPVTPHHHQHSEQSYNSLSADFRSAYLNNSTALTMSDYNSYPDSKTSPEEDEMSKALRNDLLMAADSVTNAMSTLVQELNSEEDRAMKPLDYYYESTKYNVEMTNPFWSNDGKFEEEMNDVRFCKLPNGSMTTSNGLHANGGIGMTTQFHTINGKYMERDGKKLADYYDKQSDSLGRHRRRSFGNDDSVYSRLTREGTSVHVMKGEQDHTINGNGNGAADWEDGLLKRV